MRNRLPVKSTVRDGALILVGSVLYALATQLFIFPHSILLGGTSGLSVIVCRFLPLTSGVLTATVNVFLLLVALLFLGVKDAAKTFLGSTLTSAFFALFDRLLTFDTPLIENALPSAVTGAALIAVASLILFSVGSSSGGTDIIALIIKKFSSMNIGIAIFIADILIVVIGVFFFSLETAIASLVAFPVKVIGIALFTALFRRAKKQKM